MNSNRPFYHKYAWAYDQIIHNRNTTFTEFIKKETSNILTDKGKKALDAGCGTGTYSIILSEIGFDVTAVDLSKDLLDIAKNKNGNKFKIEFIQQDISNLNYKDHFHLILCRGVLNDIISEKIREKIFSVFNNCLKKNGLLILDVRNWEETKIRKKESPVFKTTFKTPNGNMNFISKTEIGDDKMLNIIESYYFDDETAKKNEFQFQMRCWTINEIIKSCTKNNFEIIKMKGAYDNSITIGESDRIVLVAEKRSN